MLECYSCDTIDDDVSRCPTTKCGEVDTAVCYKIERNFREVRVLLFVHFLKFSRIQTNDQYQNSKTLINAVDDNIIPQGC